MDIKWIEHKSKKILFLDYTGLKMEKEMIALTERATPFIQSLEKGSKVLFLIDLTGCYVTPGFLAVARKLKKDIVENYNVSRAIIGITGPKSVLLKGFNMFTRQKLEPFNTREMALEYLTNIK